MNWLYMMTSMSRNSMEQRWELQHERSRYNESNPRGRRMDSGVFNWITCTDIQALFRLRCYQIRLGEGLVTCV